MKKSKIQNSGWYSLKRRSQKDHGRADKRGNGKILYTFYVHHKLSFIATQYLILKTPNNSHNAQQTAPSTVLFHML